MRPVLPCPEEPIRLPLHSLVPDLSTDYVLCYNKTKCQMQPPTARHPAERLTRLNQIRRMTSKVRNDTNLPWYNQKGRRSQKPPTNARLDLDRNECVVDSA